MKSKNLVGNDQIEGMWLKREQTIGVSEISRLIPRAVSGHNQGWERNSEVSQKM
jgi:hypothetical protein